MNALDRFDGEFSFLPFEAHVRHGAVPLYPVAGDFELAESVFVHALTPAALWRREAIRWRCADGRGKPLDLPAIARAVAAKLFTMTTLS